MSSPRQLPSMPEIGRPEAWYAKRVHQADRIGDRHAREAFKVGQYVTLALDPNLGWEEKLKYFRHALKRHCVPPPFPDEEIWLFYRELANVVRQYAGQEALRIASAEDDLYAKRIAMGQEKSRIADEAEGFFTRLMGIGDLCPEHFNETDWRQLRMIRDQWV